MYYELLIQHNILAKMSVGLEKFNSYHVASNGL